MNWDPLLTINLILCIIILALGIWAYIKNKVNWPLYIGIAFGLFGISHLFAILGLTSGLLYYFLVVIRLIAYLLVVYTLIMALVNKQK
jgi:hypothetical protein